MIINEDLMIGGTNKTLKTLNNEVNKTVGHILYENPVGTTSDITLNDSAANYSGIRIEWITGLNNDWYTTYLDNPNGKSTTLFFMEAARPDESVVNGSFLFAKRIYIYNNSISLLYQQKVIANIDATVALRDDRFKITKVIGYK